AWTGPPVIIEPRTGADSANAIIAASSRVRRRLLGSSSRGGLQEALEEPCRMPASLRKFGPTRRLIATWFTRTALCIRISAATHLSGRSSTTAFRRPRRRKHEEQAAGGLVQASVAT